MSMWIRCGGYEQNRKIKVIVLGTCSNQHHILIQIISVFMIVKKAFIGPVTPYVPASILQLHPDVIVVGDEAAFSKL